VLFGLSPVARALAASFSLNALEFVFVLPPLGAERKGGGREKGDANLSYASYNYEDLINRDKASLDIFWL